MERHKLESASLFLTILAAMLITPPLVLVFQVDGRFLGIPAEVVYLFVAWAAMIAGAWWLSRRMPRERAPEPPAEDDV
jgi:hypothetical protein